MSEVESRAARRDALFFREVLAELPASGLTLKALAVSKGIKPATLHAWSSPPGPRTGPPTQNPPRPRHRS